MQLEAVCSIPIDEYLLTRIAFTPDGQHILIGHRNPALYGILSGRSVRSYRFDSILGPVVFSRNGCYMALANESDNHPRTPGLARIFDSATGDLVHELKTEFPIGSCCFQERENDVLFLYRDAVSDETRGVPYLRNIVRGCRMPSGEPELELELPEWEIRAMACHQDRLSLFGLDSVARTRRIEGAGIDYRTFKVGTFALPGGEPKGICELGIGIGPARFSPAGRLLAAEMVSFTENARRLYVLDPSCGVVRTLLTIQAGVIPSMGFSEDDRYLVYLSEVSSGAGNTLRVWDMNTLALAGQAPLGLQYHAVAMHNATSRIAALGGGRCDIGLFQLETE